MNKTILSAALLISTGAVSANDTINENSRFLDVKLGSTTLETEAINGNTIDFDNKSFGVEYSHMLLTLSDDNNLYLGINGGVEVHDGDDSKNIINNYEILSINQGFTTYSTYVGPSIYFSPIEKVKLFTKIGISYNWQELEVDLKSSSSNNNNTFSADVDLSGWGYIFSFGGKYSITDSFDIGVQYQINATNLKENGVSADNDFDSIYATVGFKL